MRSKFLATSFFAILVLTFFTGCDKRGGGGGCLTKRSVYANGTMIALAFVNKEGVNLLNNKELQSKDIELKYGNTTVDTLLLYSGVDRTALKYISFYNLGNVGENNLTINLKGTSHSVTFNQKLVPGNCAGPNFDLSNFKLDNKITDPVLISETVYIRGNKIQATFPTLYIII